MLEQLRGFGDQWVWTFLITVMASVGAVCAIHGIAARLGDQSKRFNFAWSGALRLNNVWRFYKSRICWRVVARVSAFMHSRRTGPGLKMPRLLGVLLAGSLAAVIVYAVIFCLGDSRPVKDIARHLLFGEHPSGGTWSLFYTFASSPVALVLWIFRDANQVQQIENQRKDTNLKDFQKLCEWASGSALEEDEVTTDEKQRDQTIKTKRPPQNTLAANTSRRLGSEALQIASVQQLGGYLLGENGQQFQRPAMELLIALWRAQTQGIRMAASSLREQEETDKSLTFTVAVLNSAENVQKTDLARALSYALLANGNRALLKLSPFLPRQALTGLNTNWPGLSPLKLWNCSLDGIELQAARLERAALQGASLSSADLTGARLDKAQLQGASLSKAILHHTKFIEAVMDGAKLQDVYAKHVSFEKARLHDADLSGATVVSANFKSCALEGSRLIHTNMHYADFSNANLCAVLIVNPILNAQTIFASAVTDDLTRVGVVHPLHETRKSRDWHPVLTHALRLKLKNAHRLELSSRALQEFANIWEQIDHATQNEISFNIYSHVADPTTFLQMYPQFDHSQA